jgi:hypothetical protein
VVCQFYALAAFCLEESIQEQLDVRLVGLQSRYTRTCDGEYQVYVCPVSSCDFTTHI